ncbi:MAG: asparaginase [Oscillospiraceae bacterium]|nr:asparaginase [Oscillospiraceae bacterium]
MKHILLIATGGTIASLDTGTGLTPELRSEELTALVPELEDVCRCDALQLMNLDSTNISAAHWLDMARCVRAHYDAYDGFVITHGTDTMAYTAAALSYLIQNSAKPVVITGAQKSISLRDTDARENLLDAFLYAADDGACGVHIVFDHMVILGTRARKMRTKSYHAFDSVDYPPTAIIRNHKLVYYIREIVTGAPVFSDAMASGVFVLKLIPGTSAAVFEALRAHCSALVIESFGVGGLPQYADSDFYDAVRAWIASGRMLVMTTQVPFEGSDMEVYQVGQRAKRELGLIEAYGMTTEAVVTKLMWILAQTEDPDERRRLFETPVCRDQIF